MYCIVCLKNSARDFFCPSDEHMIKQILRSGQIKVSNDVTDNFKTLLMSDQWKVIYLTNKRLGKALKSGVYKETDFRIEIMIREYTEMVILGHTKLEIPPCDRDDTEARSYTQYTTMRGGIM